MYDITVLSGDVILHTLLHYIHHLVVLTDELTPRRSSPGVLAEQGIAHYDTRYHVHSLHIF